MPDQLLDDDRERHRHHGQIQTRDPNRRNAQQETREAGDEARHRNRHQQRHALGHRPGMGVGPNRYEGGMPQDTWPVYPVSSMRPSAAMHRMNT